MSRREQHPLFERYPLDGTILIGGEQVSTPYHIYDGSILLVGGVGDRQVARQLLHNERLTPIEDHDGNALMAVWVCDFTQANLGAHHELQISIFASFTPQLPVVSHSFAIYRLMTLNPDMMMVCHGLWNSTTLVTQYNREHLDLNARQSISQIDDSGDGERWRFSVQDVESREMIADGDLRRSFRQEPGVLWDMTQHLGWRGMLRTLRSPFIQMPVVNTRRDAVMENQIARTYTRNDAQVIRYFDGRKDRITLCHPSYAALNFRPQFVQYSSGVRFVYLRPGSSSSTGLSQ